MNLAPQTRDNRLVAGRVSKEDALSVTRHHPITPAAIRTAPGDAAIGTERKDYVHPGSLNASATVNPAAQRVSGPKCVETYTGNLLTAFPYYMRKRRYDHSLVVCCVAHVVGGSVYLPTWNELIIEQSFAGLQTNQTNYEALYAECLSAEFTKRVKHVGVGQCAA